MSQTAVTLVLHMYKSIWFENNTNLPLTATVLIFSSYTAQCSLYLSDI